MEPPVVRGILTGVELGGVELGGVELGVEVGLLVGTGGLQSKSTLWMPMSHFLSWPWSGILKITEVAPPHCELVNGCFSEVQDTVCVHVVLSGI